MASHGTQPDEGLRLLKWQRKDSAIFAHHQHLFRCPEDVERERLWDNFNGPVARERLTRVWATGDLNPFYLTVSRMVSMKFEVHSWWNHGFVLRRSCASSDEVLCCRVAPEEPSTVLTVEVTRQAAKLEVVAREMSGRDLFNVEMGLDTTWWSLSQLCFTTYKLVNVRFVKCDKMVGRMWWHENIDAYFPDEDAPHPGPVPKNVYNVDKKKEKKAQHKVDTKKVAKKPAQKEKKASLTDLVDSKVVKVSKKPAMKKPAAK